MRWHSILLTVASTLSLALAASSARADEPLISQYENSRVGLATEIWPTSDFAIATMAIEGQVALTKNAALDFSFPNWTFGGGSGVSSAGFGGVMVGAHGVGHVDRDIALFGGFQLTVPTTWKNPSDKQISIEVLGADTRAEFDLGRVFPEILTLKFPLGAEMKFDFFYIRPTLALPIYIPVGDIAKDANVAVVLETAVELEARHPVGFGGGLRFQSAFLLTSQDTIGGTDHAQAALEPFVGYEAPGKDLGAYARLGLLFALDTPLGFGFDKDKLAAIDIKVGAKF
jgi:hypothetical protein